MGKSIKNTDSLTILREKIVNKNTGLWTCGSGSALIFPPGSGSAFRKTTGSGSAKNECGSTDLQK